MTLFSATPELPVTEADVRRRVLDAARKTGWKVFALPQQTGTRTKTSVGWPDLFLVKGNRALALELKAPTGDVKPKQQQWLDALDNVVGITAQVVWPADVDQIERLLASGHTNGTPEEPEAPTNSLW